jgi:hypothetical protein
MPLIRGDRGSAGFVHARNLTAAAASVDALVALHSSRRALSLGDMNAITR